MKRIQCVSSNKQKEGSMKKIIEEATAYYITEIDKSSLIFDDYKYK